MKPVKTKIGKFMPLPSDDILVIRGDRALFTPAKHEDGDPISENSLVLMGVARCFGDPEFRAMMQLVVKDAVDAGDLGGVVDMGVRQ